VLSVSPALIQSPGAGDAARIAAALKDGQPERAMPAAFRRPDLRFGRAILRWAEQPVALPEIGEWVAADDRRLPAWLRVFNGGTLVAWDTEGRVAAGVGIKRHNAFGHELAVATEPAHRGRGLARLLVAQAARRVVADGAIPLYLHAPGNLASARVADAAGFPDRGWRLMEVS
jgi:GNAT superfamily N-acetyltransferase